MNTKKSFGLLLSLIIILSSLLIIGLVNPDIFRWNQTNNGDENQTESLFTNVTMIVDFGNLTVNIHENISIYDETTTVFHVLDNYYSVEYDSYSNGKLVTSINGIQNSVSENTFWFYWINNEYVNLASSSFMIQSNMTILWNYTSYQF